MSGIEVAGLVLGALPLIVTALDIYKGTVSKVSKWRRYEREVDRLIRCLRLEDARLQSICEKLLGGSVSGTDIAAMIKDPGGPLWKDNGLHQKLEPSWRLWYSGEDLMGTIEDIKSAVDEIKDKLKLVDGKIQWSESRIQREFKRASFTLDSANYKELLDRITNGITQIDSVLNANIALEAPRRSRSQYWYYKALRNISSSLYQAFRSVFVCKCLDSHCINFTLGRPLDILLRGGEDDEARVLKAVKFQVAITYQAGLPDSQPRTLRDGLTVRPIVPNRPLLMVTHGSSTLSTTSSSTKKTVRFSTFSIPSTPTKANRVKPSSAMSALVKGASHIPKMLSLPSPSSLQEISRLSDLCQTIQSSTRTLPRLEESYGYICDERSTKLQRYQLFPTSVSKEDNDSISLGNVLRDTSGKLPHLSLKTKFYLSLVFSSNFLQLSETGWLPDSLTHEDILFAKRNGSVGSPPYRNVFVTKSFTKPATSAETPATTTLTHNAPLFSLGILLIELMLVAPFHDLMETTRPLPGLCHDVPKHVTERKVAMLLLNRVQSEGGEAYKKAVLHCIDNDNDSNQSLEDDGTQQELYACVVKLLEQGLITLELPMQF